MNEIIASLNDCQSHTLTRADAILVAKQPHIERQVQSEIGWIRVGRDNLIDRLRFGSLDSIRVQKEPKFAIYYFSKP